jgi:glucosyl-3-phosphoglycerate synthase
VGEDRVQQFGLDSAINRLPYNRHSEELAVQSFATLLRPKVEDLMAAPVAHQLPSWSRLLCCTERLQADLAEAGQKRNITAAPNRTPRRHHHRPLMACPPRRPATAA